MALLDNMTWDEWTEKTMFECGKAKDNNFKLWLKSKESLGTNLFSGLLYGMAYNIQFQVNTQDRDHFCVISGLEGLGKSTLAIQLACVLDPTFILERICFTPLQFVSGLENAKKGQVFILDEGNLFLFSRESLSSDNRFMVKMFALMRQLNIIVLICVPNFYTLDSYVRDHRVNSWIYIYNRAKFTVFTGLAIKKLSRDGARYKSITGITFPTGHYYSGDFNKGFPILNDVNSETYKEYKGSHFREFLVDMKNTLKEKEGIREYITMTEAETMTPFKREAIVKRIKDGTLEGKQVGKLWLVSRTSIKKLLSDDKNYEKVKRSIVDINILGQETGREGGTIDSIDSDEVQ